MAENRKDQGFTKEQLEELQIDSALGGDVPFIGAAGMIGRKAVPEIIEAAGPYVKKAGLAIKEAVGEMRDFYIERQAATKAAEAVTLKEIRANLEPLESVIRRGVQEGKIPSQSLENNKGADLFIKNIKELGDFVGPEKLSKYAKLAVEDETNHRNTLSSAAKFIRAFHYDNANPEVGYLIGPSRYGGTWMTHLKGAAAETDGQLIAIMAGNNIRGVAQTIGISAAGVKVALDLTQDDKEPTNTDVQKRLQGMSGDKALQLALEVKPELAKTTESILSMVHDRYNKLKPEEVEGYMETAKRNIASDIVTGKLEKEIEKSNSAGQAYSVLHAESQHVTPAADNSMER